MEFKRMVLRLPHSAGDYASVRAAADLAELLDIELCATFIDDASLLELAGMSCVREFQPFGDGWRPIDAERLARDLKHAEEAARARFASAVGARRVGATFRVTQGSAGIVASASATDDILVLIEPRNPAERMTEQFTGLLEAAFRGPSAVMLIPSRIVRAKGAIVAVALTSDDPSLRAALAIAASAKERLVVLYEADPAESLPGLREAARARGVAVEPVVLGGPVGDTLTSALGGLEERLLVVSRGAAGLSQSIAARRAIPVLMVPTPTKAQGQE